MATANITLPDELLPRLQELARTENRTADELAAQAV
jgi:predicted transcriptional regulator